jgi:hypothetical protein
LERSRLTVRNPSAAKAAEGFFCVFFFLTRARMSGQGWESFAFPTLSFFSLKRKKRKYTFFF